MQSFDSLASLVARFRDMGAKRVFFKPLSENDNRKQQVYLGGSFEVLTFFHYGKVKAFNEVKDPNFKASLDLWWVYADDSEPAPHSQLILYPKYPEVRLSGFLLGCSIAPSRHLQPIPKEHRRGVDGRILFFGTCEDGRTLAHLAPAGSALSAEAIFQRSLQPEEGLFTEIALPETVAGNSRQTVIAALREIQNRGFVDSVYINKRGDIVPYAARNGGGYTLEAMLGIKPNGLAEPDFMGWEIKALGSDRITLMTPEPDGGHYGEHGVGAFVRMYGRDVDGKDQRYFTGTHRYGKPNTKTNMTLGLSGFDGKLEKIMDVAGSVQLIHSDGTEAASWSFTSLLSHWNRKHAFAAYIPYENSRTVPPCYRYTNPVLFGEHTDFSKYLTAIAREKIYFDPGSKIEGLRAGKPKVKARSQFRVSRRHLPCLYEVFESVALD